MLTVKAPEHAVDPVDTVQADDDDARMEGITAPRTNHSSTTLVLYMMMMMIVIRMQADVVVKFWFWKTRRSWSWGGDTGCAPTAT